MSTNNLCMLVCNKAMIRAHCHIVMHFIWPQHRTIFITLVEMCPAVISYLICIAFLAECSQNREFPDNIKVSFMWEKQVLYLYENRIIVTGKVNNYCCTDCIFASASCSFVTLQILLLA